MLEMILLSFQNIYCNGSDGLENILQSKLRPLALWHLQRAVPAHCQHKKMHPGETCFSLPAHSSYFAAAAAKSLQLCPTPSDPMDCSLPGSSIHGIFQARVLEWGANLSPHLTSL